MNPSSDRHPGGAELEEPPLHLGEEDRGVSHDGRDPVHHTTFGRADLGRRCGGEGEGEAEQEAHRLPMDQVHLKGPGSVTILRIRSRTCPGRAPLPSAARTCPPSLVARAEPRRRRRSR